MSVRNLMKGLSGALTPIQKSVFAFDPRLRRVARPGGSRQAQSSRSGRGGAIERINKGKKAIYDSFRLILFEMLHGRGIFKNGDCRK